MELYHQLKRLHLVHPLGGFRDWRRALADAGLEVKPIKEHNGWKLVAVKRPERRPCDATEPSAGARLPQTNRILCYGLPRAAFGPHKEPVALVENLDMATLRQDPVFMEHHRRAVHDWAAKGLLPPAWPPPSARSASTVHKTTATVGARSKCPRAQTPEKAAAYGHPP